MNNRFQEVLSNRESNYMMPFFWMQNGRKQHEDLRARVAEVEASGCRAFCVESRTHQDFGGVTWWQDMDVLLDEAEKRGMKVWVLDDRHFPTGMANELIEKKYPERRRWFLREEHRDVYGPMKGVSLLLKNPPEEDVLRGVRMLAHLHKGLRQVDATAFFQEDSLLTEYTRHNAELRRARNFVRKVRHKSEMELAMMGTFAYYYDQALEAQRLLEQWESKDIIGSYLCHGDYSHHHILYDGEFAMVTDLMAMTRGVQVSDLYYLMRKAMEKQGFDCGIGHKMLEEYDRHLPLTKDDRRYLYIRFLYPEKYWKQINYYFNSNKAWIPVRSIEKIRALQELEPERRKFLEFLQADGA